MKIERVQIKNFRILKDFEVDFENDLSIIIGKNNAGKTSFLAVLEKFLSSEKPVFSFEDISISEQNKICDLKGTALSVDEFHKFSLSLKMYISYDDFDDISNASDFLLDLNENVKHFVLLMECAFTYEKYLKLMEEFNATKQKIDGSIFRDFIAKNTNKYFTIRAFALEYNNEENSKEIAFEKIHQVISMQTISAKRDVDNEGRNKSLSTLAHRYYKNINSDTAFPMLQQQLLETDGKLTAEYKAIFADVTKEIKEMSYNPKEAEIEIISSLVSKPIFQDNTIVKYKHNDTLLPEDYNGLGYLNLFAIMFDIRIKLDKLAKKNNSGEKPAPINLLFIEEPEAHTHPQMQYVFITNIKQILKKQQTETAGFALQTVISTHSAHIVSQCDFKDIKYFYRNDIDGSNVKSKSLEKLHMNMVASDDAITRAEQERSFRFVKQYITLNRSELFFADKAILIEGDTERILLTAMMQKYDNAHRNEENFMPLLSQNISVIEVGAYSHVFATFLEFIGINTLIFTDLDCAKINENNRASKCKFSEATTTTNASIKYFTGKTDISEIVALTDEQKTFGKLKLMFQTEENNYQPSSFEDAFLCCNLKFVVDNKDKFEGLKCRNELVETAIDFYNLAHKCLDSKTTFALDILMNGGKGNENWNIPSYIMEGFKWLSM